MKIDFNNPLLLHLLRNPQSKYHVRELITILHRNPKMIVSDIKYLNTLNIIDIKQSANLKTIKLSDTEFTKTLKKMWILGVLNKILKKLDLKEVRKIILYGSFANQKYVSKSDLDLLILTEDEPTKDLKVQISNTITELESIIDKELSLIFMAEIEFYHKVKNKDKFANNVYDLGIVVYEQQIVEDSVVDGKW